jgi:rod shape determining protein RodA
MARSVRTWHAETVARRLAASRLLLPVIAALLGGVGVLALYSAAGGVMEPYAMSHLLRLVAGVAVMLVIAQMPSRLWLLLAIPTYVVALAMLAAVPWLGTAISGSQRWLSLGSVTLQPAEIMKLALVLLLAAFYRWLPRHLVSRPLYVFLPLLAVAVPTGLVLEQPDLGTAALIAATGLVLMFLAGVGTTYFLTGLAGVAIIAPLFWSALHDYQRERILVFLDPERDLSGAGYQVYQARIALAAGGLSGKGFLQGTQNQLDFVPENHTDFILSLIGEELGFAGVAGVLLLFGLLLLVLVLLSFAARGRLQRLFIMGVSVLVFLQMAINTGMVIGLLPVVGVPLPLVSFGGSAMLTTLVALGIAMSMRAEGQSDVGWNRRTAWRLRRGEA